MIKTKSGIYTFSNIEIHTNTPLNLSYPESVRKVWISVNQKIGNLQLRSLASRKCQKNRNILKSEFWKLTRLKVFKIYVKDVDTKLLRTPRFWDKEAGCLDISIFLPYKTQTLPRNLDVRNWTFRRIVNVFNRGVNLIGFSVSACTIKL